MLATLALVLAIMLSPPAFVYSATPDAEWSASTVRHLRLLRSEPSADTTLTAAPRELRLWFSQRPEIALTSARLARGNHQSSVGKAALRDTDREGVLVVMPIQDALTNGRYKVSWRAMASDGHVVTGEFNFTVAAVGKTGAR